MGEPTQEQPLERIRHHGGCSPLRVPPRRIRCTPRSAFKTPLSPRVDKLSVPVISSGSRMLEMMNACTSSICALIGLDV